VSKTIGGILLVSGTTVGAGMLALPVVTGFAGFVPSVFLMLAYWLFMTFIALLILEVNLWMEKPGANMTTMARMTLGKWGEGFAWIVYLYLLYALTTAYLAGGGPIFNEIVEGLTGWDVPHAIESLPLLLVFGYFVYRGAHTVDWMNRLLMVGLVAVYGLVVVFLVPHLSGKLLSYSNASLLWVGSSVAATSFGFHIIIPTLTAYLERDVKELKRVIWIGSAIPLVVYLVWEFLVLGIVPVEGPISLSQGYAEGSNGAALLSAYLGNSLLGDLLKLFLLLAIVTSFLGVSTSLTDFLADGFNVKKTLSGKLWLLLLTFGPPLLFVMTEPRAFLLALEYAGAFGVVILLGLLPALMVWAGRKKFAQGAPYLAPGGTPMLLLTIILSVGVIVIELLQKGGVLWIKSGS
jgi:tyrosine-specific transport protein